MTEAATLTLTNFLLAQFAEDQEKLTLHSTDCRYLASDTYEECDCNGDAFLVASIEAKRRIVEDCAVIIATPDIDDPTCDGLAVFVLRQLALPYADRPGFREEWR